MLTTLHENAANVAKWTAEYAAIKGADLAQRAQARKEYAADPASPSDLSAIQASEGRFIDVAIHKDSWASGLFIVEGLDVDTPPIWKTRYKPTVGVTTGSVYGKGMSTMYITQDNFAAGTPYVIDTEEPKVPAMSTTQDPSKLGQREAALERQVEALKLGMEQYGMNFLCQQPVGTDIASSVVNQMAIASPYSGKTVYVADPGVQSGTYETSNNINVSAEGGLTPAVFEALHNQAFLSGRTPTTVHIPVAGMPWRTLMRFATIIGGTVPGSGSSPNTPNPDLKSLPPSKWEEIWNTNFYEGIVVNYFGLTLRFKANNVLPQGYCVVTTNQPAGVLYNLKGRAISVDHGLDPRNPYWVSHYEKREISIVVPDPWVRNVWFLNIGSTSF